MLFFNQVVRFGYYSHLSKNNSIRVIPIDGPRGNLFDRNGTPLVTNTLCFDVSMVYQELKNREALCKVLSDVLGMTRADILSALQKARTKPYVPVVIAEDIGKEKALIIEEASFDTGGLNIETRSRRNYIYKETGCHVFGYLSEVTEEELDNLRDYGYRMKDLIGRSGLEKYYNDYLAGSDGGTQIEVDSRGRQTRVLGVKEPACGKDLYLTIDIDIQSVCDNMLGDKRGAIVALDPGTGEVLALASHPSFDPNVFVRPGKSRQRIALLSDRRGRPLSNRAISATYSPGSVFKIVVASAALESKKITPLTQYNCTGSYTLGRAKFDCWKDTGHAAQNIADALMNSCNVFFYNAGRAAGADNIESFARIFGFGGKTGIDLPDEVSGIVPGRSWKEKYRKDVWYEGDTVNYSIGQGYLLVTPIQVAVMTAVEANSGYLIKPFIVKRIDKEDISHPVRKKTILKDGTIREVRKGLYKVINDENGTGRRAEVEGLAVAGKTGTAQNPQGRTHAWFAGFAPFNDPKICLAIFIEHGGKGGLEPSEIAHEIFETAKSKGYFK